MCRSQSPDELQNLITDCLAIVSQNEFKVLPPYYRRWIYDFTMHNESRNQRFVVWMGILSTEKVLLYWNDNLVDGYSPQALLDLALNIMRGELDKHVASFKYEWSQSILDTNARDDGDRKNTESFFVALAAHETLRTALGGEAFHNLPLIESDADENLDYNYSDAAFYAAEVYAGAKYANNFDTDRSYEFWTWWLTEAVPKAWYEAQLA